jgi:plastocyanin
MRRLLALVAILALTAVGCTGSQDGSDGTGMMNMPAPSGNGSVSAVVSIVGQKAAQSFDPNPAPITPGSLVVWHNMDNASHHIVMNDGSFDSGDIMPGGSSQMMRLGSAGGNYHCTIHPTTMFGSINVTTAEPPSSRPGY